MDDATFDEAEGHRRFSGAFFNEAWDLLDAPARTPEDEELLLALVHGSICHWLKRPDCTDQHLSVGYWQASRASAVVGLAEEARRLGTLCLARSEALAPFYRGYAHEALARAAALAGDAATANHHLAEARRLAGDIEDPEERSLLESDLDTI